METKITIGIADDEMLFTQGLRAILLDNNEVEVLFDAVDGLDLIRQLRDSNQLPDIVLTDLKMPELNGVEVTKLIKTEFPHVKVIALTSYYSKPFVLNMISIGAVAYLGKNCTSQSMLKTIKEVAANGFYYDDIILKYIHEGLLSDGGVRKVKSSFDSGYYSKREMEVIELICRQFTTLEIAEKLFVSPRTVDGHRTSLLLKTGTKNIAGLVAFALQHKIVNLSSPFSN